LKQATLLALTGDQLKTAGMDTHARHQCDIEKVRDIVGLYMNPPDHALGFCFDEKSQIRVLDRTQPLLPMQPGQLGGAPTTTNAMQLPRCLPRWS
jgi:hypothetical protein